MLAQDEDLIREDSAPDGAVDREAHSKFWIAAYTRPKSERKAAKELGKVNIETYVPVQNVTHQWSDRKKKIDIVVIPMIIFLRITKEEILTVKKHPLVIKVLCLPGNKSPAKIPEDQIENLRLMLKNAEKPVKFVGTSFKLTDRVIVKSGKLEGLIGKVERIDGGKARLVVSIDLLGGAMVEISTEDLEIYNKN